MFQNFKSPCSWGHQKICLYLWGECGRFVSARTGDRGPQLEWVEFYQYNLLTLSHIINYLNWCWFIWGCKSNVYFKLVHSCALLPKVIDLVLKPLLWKVNINLFIIIKSWKDFDKSNRKRPSSYSSNTAPHFKINYSTKTIEVGELIIGSRQGVHVYSQVLSICKYMSGWN